MIASEGGVLPALRTPPELNVDAAVSELHTASGEEGPEATEAAADDVGTALARSGDTTTRLCLRMRHREHKPAGVLRGAYHPRGRVIRRCRLPCRPR